MKKVSSALALMALVVVGLLLPAPASAAVTSVWAKHGSVEVVSDHSVKLNRPTADVSASYEAANLDLPVEAGNVFAVSYELSGDAKPDAGAVRLFIYDKANADTMKDAPTQFVAAEATSGTLAITVNFTGKIGTAGLVYDTSNASTGTATFNDLKLNRALVNFNATTGEPDLKKVTAVKPVKGEVDCKTGVMNVVLPENPVGYTYKTKPNGTKVRVTAKAAEGYVLEGKTAWTLDFTKEVEACKPTNPPTDEPTEEPTADPEPTDTATAPVPTPSGSSSATVVPGAVGGTDGGDLPKTGVKALTIGGVGGLLVAVGGLLFVWARKRRDDAVMHGDNDATLEMRTI